MGGDSEHMTEPINDTPTVGEALQQITSVLERAQEPGRLLALQIDDVREAMKTLVQVVLCIARNGARRG